jgi:hypothetical protein
MTEITGRETRYTAEFTTRNKLPDAFLAVVVDTGIQNAIHI